jgi:hypothetical protein
MRAGRRQATLDQGRASQSARCEYEEVLGLVHRVSDDAVPKNVEADPLRTQPKGDLSPVRADPHRLTARLADRDGPDRFSGRGGVKIVGCDLALVR